MAGWKDNAIMLWNGTKVTDHGRDPLSMSSTRIGSDQRMANGTLRRHHVVKKRTWSIQWNNIPHTNLVSTGMKTADLGMSGGDIEAFYNTNDGKFRMVLKRGSAMDLAVPNPAESALPFEDTNFYITNVMITEYSRDTVKRGKVDIWNISMTIEEV